MIVPDAIRQPVPASAEDVDRLTAFCARLRYEDLPAGVVEEAKDRLLDFLGCVLGGSLERSSRTVRDVLETWGGSREATVAATRLRLPAPLAAFANGAAGHALEMDDDHKEAILHPGVCVVPAALAVSERRAATGRDLLLGIVVGYEVMCRVGAAARPDVLLAKGFHPTGVCGAFGAAAAAASVQASGYDVFRAALGIAGSFASGLFEFVNDGSLVKRLHPANAAKSGILAADLAAAGYSGAARVLDGRLGFFAAFAGGSTGAPLSDRLGETYEIRRTSYKQYACCSYCHPLMDALRELVVAHPIGADDVEEILGRTFTAAIHIVGEPREQKQAPASPVDAQFSAPYGLATLILRGRALPGEFAPAAVEDPAIRALTRRIRVEAAPEFDAGFPRRYPAEVRVRLRGGQTLVRRVETSKGDPSWPLTREELETKFRTLAAGALPDGRLDAILETVRTLERVQDVAVLGRLLAT